MAFAGLFAALPNEGLHVADCAEREKTGAVKGEINLEDNSATKKSKKKKKKRNKKRGRNGNDNVHTRNVQPHIAVPSRGDEFDQEHRPAVQRGNQWHWNYDTEHCEPPRKRKRKSNSHSTPKKRDFTVEMDLYLRARDATPANSPASPFPHQNEVLSLKKEEKINMGGQENPRKTGFDKRHQEKPGQTGRAQNGRGGRGMKKGRGLQKNKLNGRNCGNERGQKRVKGEARPKEERKKVFFTQEYINRHTVEAEGRHVCKYFLRGTCLKGDQCNFEHDINVKKMELCKFYVQGYCTKENCIYMHKEFPCKFFHTGMQCHKGDACWFSHEPLTDLTKELLQQHLNRDHPAKTEEPEPMAQDSVPSFAPPVPKLTVDVAGDVFNVRPHFYSSSSPLIECQPQGSSAPALPQSSGSPNTQGKERSIPAGAAGPERGPQAHTLSPAGLHIKKERNLEAVQDELVSAPVGEGPESGTSVLKTLFLRLSPINDEPPASPTETGVSTHAHESDEGVNEQPGAPTAEKTWALGKPEMDVHGWPYGVEPQSGQPAAETRVAESASLYKPLCAQEREWKQEEEAVEEGRLRDEPALVPLDATPGVARRDPRSAPYVASIDLPLPPFAHTVKWDPEEPVPLPPTLPQTISPVPCFERPSVPLHSALPRNVRPVPCFERPPVDTHKHSSCRTLPQPASSAVHKLPVSALAGLIRPTYPKGKAASPGSERPAAKETQTKGNVLKGLFTTFLPAGDL